MLKIKKLRSYAQSTSINHNLLTFEQFIMLLVHSGRDFFIVEDIIGHIMNNI